MIVPFAIVCAAAAAAVIPADLKRRLQFIRAARCSFIHDNDDLVNYRRVLLFSFTRGFLRKTDSNEESWIGFNLLSKPTVHLLSCDSQNTCSIHLDPSESEGDRKLFVSVTRDRKLSYSKTPSNVIIKFYSKRQILVFFDKRTRRYRYSVHPTLFDKIPLC